jgi:hypothetical protein
VVFIRFSWSFFNPLVSHFPRAIVQRVDRAREFKLRHKDVGDDGAKTSECCKLLAGLGLWLMTIFGLSVDEGNM